MKFHKCSDDYFRVVITRKTRNKRSLFPLKGKNHYKSCINHYIIVIYKGDWSCGSRYIGGTKRNADVSWNEHNNQIKSPSKTIETPSKHIDHCFTWTIISNVAKNAKTRNNLEVSYITLWEPDLNEGKNFGNLSRREHLFCSHENDDENDDE